MNDESTIRNALIAACEKRGTQAEISKSFDVSQSTVKRWLEGGEIPSPMLKLLDWYFFGIVPPRLAEPSIDMQSILDFEEAEWVILSAMARREGVTEAVFIAARIRSYLAFYDSLKPQQEAPEITSFPTKAHILAAAGSPISAEVTDWDGAGDTVMVKISGLSMAPLINDGDVIAMKHKKASRNPFMKKGLIYLVSYDGGYTVKRYNTRPATADEKGEEWVERGKVKVLESINPDSPEIIIKQPLEWVAWLDKA